MTHARHRLAPPLVYALGLAFSLGATGTALFLQYGLDMLPCPLCVLQRMALCWIALACLVGLLLPARRIAKVPALLGSIIGSLLALWHLAKVHLPSNTETCGPGLATWVDSLWITDLAPWLFAPMGDCIQDAATLVGIPLPALALALFLALGGLFVINLRR